MNAILEHGGIKYSGPATLPDTKTKSKLGIFNAYLNIVEEAKNSTELRTSCFEFEFNLRYLKQNNPFKSGFGEDGFGVYLGNLRVIFVECETDIEI